MISIIVAYDDNDQELGDYFELSFDYLNEHLTAIEEVEIEPIRGLECTENRVTEVISSFDEEPFGFVGLSHGNESQLLTENEIYVDSNNSSHFQKSLFYSTACATAVELGKVLIEQECFCYVGFNEDSSATYEDYYDIYIECENHCLREFLNSEKTIKQAFDEMLSLFDNKIVDLLEQHDDEILVAMELIGNKDALVLLGNPDLVKSDLNNVAC